MDVLGARVLWKNFLWGALSQSLHLWKASPLNKTPLTVSESNNMKNRTEDFFSNYTVSGQTQAAKVCQAITSSKVIGCFWIFQDLPGFLASFSPAWAIEKLGKNMVVSDIWSVALCWGAALYAFTFFGAYSTLPSEISQKAAYDSAFPTWWHMMAQVRCSLFWIHTHQSHNCRCRALTWVAASWPRTHATQGTGKLVEKPGPWKPMKIQPNCSWVVIVLWMANQQLRLQETPDW